MANIDEIREKYKSAQPGDTIYLGEISLRKFFEACLEPEKLPPLSGPATMAGGDDVNHPAHYAANGPKCPHCGKNIECITITENMGFCLGNTVKYIWRRKEKGAPLKDLKKARWYLDREISKLEAE